MKLILKLEELGMLLMGIFFFQFSSIFMVVVSNVIFTARYWNVRLLDRE